MIRTLVRRYLCGVLVLAAAGTSQAQTLETFAGGRIIDNLPANQSPMTSGSIVTAVDGTVYVVDIFRHKLMRRDPTTGILTRFPAGVTTPPWNAVDQVFRSVSGVTYVIGGGALYQLFLPDGQTNLITRLDNAGTTGCSNSTGNSQFAADWNGTVYFTDPARNSLCKVLGFNSIQRIAGADAAGFAGDGGAAQFARFNQPVGLALDGSNNIFIADFGNNRVRRIDASTGIVSTFAGNGISAPSGENVNAATASLAAPTYLATDANQHLFIAEIEATRVRRVNPFTGLMTTLAGNGQRLFDSPDGGLATQTALAWPSNIAAFPNGGDYLISDLNDARMRQVSRSTGLISTLIGNGSYNFCGESALPRELCMDQPRGVAVGANDDVYIADVGNRRIRKYSTATGLLTTIAGRDGPSQYQGEGGPAIDANFGETLGGLSLDAAGNIFVAVGYGERVTRIDSATGIITTVAGSGLRGFAGDGGLATAARTNYIASVAVDSAGNIFFSDKNNHRVRKVTASSGIITTVAGNGLSTGALGDNGPATSASLAYPDKVGFDNAGNLLIADTQHSRIRKVNKTNGTITTIIGNGSFTNSGDGGSAIFAGLNGVEAFAVDPSGNIFVVSQATVRRVDATNGIINKIPNLPMQTPEGFWIIGPDDLALDSQGRLYMGTSEAVIRVNGIPPLVPADTTPPIIGYTMSGGAGTNGWYRGTSPVQLQFQPVDFESIITSQTGCGYHEVNSDTAGTTFTCTVTSAGGTSTKSITIKRDSVAPTLVFGAATPAPDAAGWNSSDVGVPFTASDALSGVFTTSPGSPVSITGTGTGLSAQVIVTDVAGNTATFTTPSVNIDRSAPMVTTNVSGTLGSNDWYTSDVQISWAVTDANSSIATTEGCETTTVVTDIAGVTYTCTATSAGGSTTKSVTVKRDATAPTLEFGTPSPAANADGWHGADVSIPFTASDATSGVVSTSPGSPVSINGTGANLSTEVIVTDAAGNQATLSTPAVNIDRSAPEVHANVSGTSGSDGWYTSDVQISWATNDDLAPATGVGCETSSVTTDTAGVTFTCTSTSAGGTTTESVTVKRDAAAPLLSFGALVPAANAVGWHTTDVSIPFTTNDAMSGVASASKASPLAITGEGVGLESEVVVTDGAGNSATFSSPPANIDRSAPSVLPVVSGTVGNNGWYTSDVQVSWVVDESPANIVSQSGCGAANITADSAGAILTCSVVSGGGSASSSVTLKRDATAPVLTFGSITPVANVNGWNKTNVSVPFTRSDAMSGLSATSATSPIVLSTEAAGVTAQVTVVDLAGNSATYTSAPRNIDKTAPYAEMETPEDGATYGLYANVPADFVCEDLSLVSCTAPVAQGAFINTTSAGSKTFKVTAKDQSLFTTNHTHAYTVASAFNFDGFLAPLRAPSTLNLVTRGSVVPLRWRLPDGQGGFVTNPASFVSATVTTFTCSGSSVVLNDVASGAEGLGFDAASGTFTYNWQTNAGWTGCRKLVIKLKDNSTHEARFKLQ